MKIDVEGAELKVLQGSRSLFSSSSAKPRLFMIELYDSNLAAFGTSISTVVELMQAWRYRPYVLIDEQKVAFTPAHHNQHFNVFFER